VRLLYCEAAATLSNHNAELKSLCYDCAGAGEHGSTREGCTCSTARWLQHCLTTMLNHNHLVMIVQVLVNMAAHVEGARALLRGSHTAAGLLEVLLGPEGVLEVEGLQQQQQQQQPKQQHGTQVCAYVPVQAYCGSRSSSSLNSSMARRCVCVCLCMRTAAAEAVAA